MKPDPEFSSSDDTGWDDLFRAYRPVPLPDDFASRVLKQTAARRSRNHLIIGLAMVLLLGSIGMLLATVSATMPALSDVVTPLTSVASTIADLLQTLETIFDILRSLVSCLAPAGHALQQASVYGGGLLMSAAFLLGLLVLLHVRSIHPITKP